MKSSWYGCWGWDSVTWRGVAWRGVVFGALEPWLGVVGPVPLVSSNCLSAGVPVGITPVVSQLRLGGLTNVVPSREAPVVEGLRAPSTKIGMELIPY